jgi:hypothetical protein
MAALVNMVREAVVEDGVETMWHRETRAPGSAEELKQRHAVAATKTHEFYAPHTIRRTCRYCAKDLTGAIRCCHACGGCVSCHDIVHKSTCA